MVLPGGDGGGGGARRLVRSLRLWRLLLLPLLLAAALGHAWTYREEAEESDRWVGGWWRARAGRGRTEGRAPPPASPTWPCLVCQASPPSPLPRETRAGFALRRCVLL